MIATARLLFTEATRPRRKWPLFQRPGQGPTARLVDPTARTDSALNTATDALIQHCARAVLEGSAGFECEV